METSKLVEEIQKLLKEADEALRKSRSRRVTYFQERLLIHERYLSQERRIT